MQPHVKHNVSVSTSTTLTCHKHCPYRRSHKSCCVNFPSTYPPLHPYTLIFSNNVMVCPQILTPSLDRAGTNLDMGKLAMSGFHSRPIIQLKAQHDMLRGELARMHCVATCTQNKPLSDIQRGGSIWCSGDSLVSYNERDSAPKMKQ